MQQSLLYNDTSGIINHDTTSVAPSVSLWGNTFRTNLIWIALTKVAKVNTDTVTAFDSFAVHFDSANTT